MSTHPELSNVAATAAAAAGRMVPPEGSPQSTATTTTKRSLEDVAAHGLKTTATDKQKSESTIMDADPVPSSVQQSPAEGDEEPEEEEDNPTKPPAAKVAKIDKAYRGLRHFSFMVCKKVEEKGTTSYNEVADELVATVIEERKREEQPSSDSKTVTPTGRQYDEKNIRRRVYDALNVLMAMDVIVKDKKQITWKGLPSSATQDLAILHREWQYRQAEVQRKREALKELLTQQVCFRNLVHHNVRRTEKIDTKKDNQIPLPFLVVNTSSKAVISCNMSRDLTNVMFDFSMPFEINDDNAILKRLGL
jgi:transcription factor Dp-1